MEDYEVEANRMRHALPDNIAHIHADYYTQHDHEKFLPGVSGPKPCLSRGVLRGVSAERKTTILSKSFLRYRQQQRASSLPLKAYAAIL